MTGRDQRRFLPENEKTGLSVTRRGGGRCRQVGEKTIKAGGKMSGEPVDIPGVGRYVSFIDPEGNRVTMLEPVTRN